MDRRKQWEADFRPFGVFGNLRPEIRAARLLRSFERPLNRLRAVAASALSREHNPISQAAAVANLTFLVSLASGILLIFWYVPSVHEAWESVDSMGKSPFLAGLLRSLHRYSSDACMLFVILHACQVFFARRFAGARWLPWVTGVALTALLWFDGWLGYWLVWDSRAAEIARASARFLDVFPLFAVPFSMSFVADGAVSSLLFFLVFFLHMIIPVGFGIALWLHVSRLTSSRFLTNHGMSLLVALFLVGLSLLFPAASSRRAEMLAMPRELTIDLYYMLPLYLTNRLGGGVLWWLAFGAALLFTTVPFYMVRRQLRPAAVFQERCNGCSNCFNDCPFSAVQMQARDGTGAQVSRIDPARCIACSICVGSCDRGAIEFPEMPLAAARKKMIRWLGDDAEAGRKRFLAFLCADSPVSSLSIDQAEGLCDSLPGFRLMVVPCIGWVHHSLIEGAASRGAAGVLLVGCGPDSHGRNGKRLTSQRIAGTRTPALLRTSIGDMPLSFVQFEEADLATLLQVAKTFSEGDVAPQGGAARMSSKLIIRAGLMTLCAGLIVGLSDAPFLAAGEEHSELTVAFSHFGRPVDAGGPGPEKRNDSLPHMRGIPTERSARAPVRLRVTVDGEIRHEKAYRPGGLFQNGASNAVVNIPLGKETHRVGLQIGETNNSQEWSHRTENTIEYRPGYRHAVTFNKTEGFTWH